MEQDGCRPSYQAAHVADSLARLRYAPPSVRRYCIRDWIRLK